MRRLAVCAHAPRGGEVVRWRGRLRMSARTARATTARSQASRAALRSRPEWDSSPLRHPPGPLTGMRPTTREPWSARAHEDLAQRMEFGSRSSLGLEPLVPYNGLVEQAATRRRENQSAQAWDNTPLVHQCAAMPCELARANRSTACRASTLAGVPLVRRPPSLRGQKTLIRPEPWSMNHNDTIAELNGASEATRARALNLLPLRAC